MTDRQIEQKKTYIEREEERGIDRKTERLKKMDIEKEKDRDRKKKEKKTEKEIETEGWMEREIDRNGGRDKQR